MSPQSIVIIAMLVLSSTVYGTAEAQAARCVVLSPPQRNDGLVSAPPLSSQPILPAVDTSEYAYVKCSVDGLGRGDADVALVLTGANDDFGLVFQVPPEPSLSPVPLACERVGATLVCALPHITFSAITSLTFLVPEGVQSAALSVVNHDSISSGRLLQATPSPTRSTSASRSATRTGSTTATHSRTPRASTSPTSSVTITPTSTPSPSPSPIHTAGLSSFGKVGLALGLVVLFALIGGLLYWYHPQLLELWEKRRKGKKGFVDNRPPPPSPGYVSQQAKPREQARVLMDGGVVNREGVGGGLNPAVDSNDPWAEDITGDVTGAGNIRKQFDIDAEQQRLLQPSSTRQDNTSFHSTTAAVKSGRKRMTAKPTLSAGDEPDNPDVNPELAAAGESDALVEEPSEDDNVVDGDVDDGSNVASSEPSKTTKVAKSAPVNVKPRARKIAKRRKKRVSHSVTTSGAEEEEDSDTVPLQPLSKASETLIRPVTPAVSTHRPSSTVSGGSSGRLSAVLSKLLTAITSRISTKSPKPARQFQPLVIDAPAVTTAPSPVHIRVESPRTLASTPNGVTSASNVPMLPPIRRLGSRLASHAPSLSSRAPLQPSSSSPPSHHSSSSSRHPPDVLAAWKAEREHLVLLADRLRASIASRYSQKHPIAVGLGTGVGPVLGLTPWELRLLLSSADADTLAAYRDVILQECSDRGVRMMQDAQTLIRPGSSLGSRASRRRSASRGMSAASGSFTSPSAPSAARSRVIKPKARRVESVPPAASGSMTPTLHSDGGHRVATVSPSGVGRAPVTIGSSDIQWISSRSKKRKGSL